MPLDHLTSPRLEMRCSWAFGRRRLRERFCFGSKTVSWFCGHFEHLLWGSCSHPVNEFLFEDSSRSDSEKASDDSIVEEKLEAQILVGVACAKGTLGMRAVSAVTYLSLPWIWRLQMERHVLIDMFRVFPGIVSSSQFMPVLWTQVEYTLSSGSLGELSAVADKALQTKLSEGRKWSRKSESCLTEASALNWILKV